MAHHFHHIQVKPTSAFTGAEIDGVDLSVPLTHEVVAEIRKALLKWKVIFFRGQNIDHAGQVAFSRYFGEVTYAHPYEDEAPEGFPEIKPVDRRLYERRGLRANNYSSRWHTDVTAAINPPAASILRAVQVPEVGGDTHWTNLVAAYESLSAPLKALADNLRAEHRFGGGRHSSSLIPEGSIYRQRIASNPLISIHPVVRVHPETGEKALFVNPGFTSHIVDVSPTESDKLLDIFFERVTNSDFVTRFRWHQGDLAFWDNRATAHLAPSLRGVKGERVLYRTTLTGDIPVGPDGLTSTSVQGEFFGSEVPSLIQSLQQEKTLAPV